MKKKFILCMAGGVFGKIIVNGCKKLQGEITVHGAKEFRFAYSCFNTLD